MNAILPEVKYALRLFRRAPGFTLVAVAALALGIGANTGMFSVVNAVLLKPLAYPDPDRIVQFMLTVSGGAAAGGSAAEFNIWRRQTGTFQDVSAYRDGTITLTGNTYPEQVSMVQASADGFRLFGAPFQRGRGFTTEEDRPGGALVAVITDELWRRAFGGDPQLIGKAISLGGQPHTVVGILAPGFDFDSDPRPDVWIPFQLDPESTDHAHYFVVAGRLRPGVSLAQANARMPSAYAEFRRTYPNYAGPGSGFSVIRLQDRLVGDVRPALLVLSGAVGLVLLIACANVANLLLIRAVGRQREFVIRTAVGATRRRLLRQSLIESTLLALTGGAVGLAASSAGVRLLLAINPGNLPRVGASGAAVSVDGRVLAFTWLLSFTTGIMFGLVPALQSSRADLGRALKETGGRSGTGLRQNRTRSLLVIGETALAVILLIGSALLIRSFVALRMVTPGFDPHSLLTLRTSLAGTRFNRTAAVAQLVHDGAERIAAVPGALAAAAATALPLEGGSGLPFDVVNQPLPGGPVRVGWTGVSAAYFSVLRIPILRGRPFTQRDDRGSPGVVIVNRAMARKFWPDADPLGQLIVIGRGYAPGFTEPPRQIVGIAGDIHDEGLNRDPAPMVYVPLPQVAEGITTLFSRVIPLAWLVRTRGQPRPLTSSIQAELRQVSGDLPVADVHTMDEISHRSTSRQDFNMVLMAIFGGCALLLAAIGIYGLMAYSVAQRTLEIGIRVALGAGTSDVRNMVVRQGMRLALAGIGAGLAIAFAVSRVLRSLLFGIQPHDPLVFTAVPVLLCGVALVAVWLPAIRSTRIDPAQALHSE
jgi:putative ABC transport system permease protein